MFGNDYEVMYKQVSSEKAEIVAAFNKLMQHAKELEESHRQLKFDMECLEKRAALDKEKAIGDLRKEMQQSLIKSDLLRTEAVARLEVYEKTDTKADANCIKEMLGKLIENVGKEKVNVVK